MRSSNTYVCIYICILILVSTKGENMLAGKKAMKILGDEMTPEQKKKLLIAEEHGEWDIVNTY
jgi:hypothetical protein